MVSWSCNTLSLWASSSSAWAPTEAQGHWSGPPGPQVCGPAYLQHLCWILAQVGSWQAACYESVLHSLLRGGGLCSLRCPSPLNCPAMPTDNRGLFPISSSTPNAEGCYFCGRGLKYPFPSLWNSKERSADPLELRHAWHLSQNCFVTSYLPRFSKEAISKRCSLWTKQSEVAQNHHPWS